MKQYIKWTPRLAVNVDKIDDQHKELYSRMNDVVIAVMDGKGKDEISGFTRFLAEYTRTHFGDEEALMTQHKYPGYDAQRSAHIEFTKEVDKMRSQVDSGEITSDLVVDVVKKLGDWFSDHIGKMDKALGQYLKGKL
ncbi:bacteriohemerythrin [Thermodesulfobacteriota bacterium]